MFQRKKDKLAKLKGIIQANIANNFYVGPSLFNIMYLVQEKIRKVH